MREPARDNGRLQDIITYSTNVISILENVSFEQFKSDIRIYFSVMKNVEIVGEAAYMLSKEFKTNHKEVPWDTIAGMRHVLVHGYSTVVPETLWETAKNDIPALLEIAKVILSEE